MLFHFAALSMLAATAHMEQIKADRVQWVYDNGANKGYVCAVVQQNGTAFDTYLPSLWSASMQKSGATATLTAVPWLHFATSAEAMQAVTTYCPAAGAPSPVVSE